MRLLLDTNVLIWALARPGRLTAEARAALVDPANSLVVSAVCAWEIAIKLARGDLPVPPDAGRWLPPLLAERGFTPLAITLEHALGVERLPFHHRDPFDRLLIAQAILERLTIVTGDPAFESYGVPLIRCW